MKPWQPILVAIAGAALMWGGAAMLSPLLTLAGFVLLVVGAVGSGAAEGWDARDVVALGGAGSLIIAAWLVHPAAAFALIGVGLLWLWNQLVPAEGEAEAAGHGPSTFDQAHFDATLEQASRDVNAHHQRIAAAAVVAESRDLVTTAGTAPSRHAPRLPGLSAVEEGARRLGIRLPRKEETPWPQ